MATGQCLRCKAPREMKDPEEVEMKNGKHALRGTCPECNAKIFRIKKAE